MPKRKSTKSKLIENDCDQSGQINSVEDESLDSEINDEFTDAKTHKQTLESLKEKDPEFYEYLQKHDKSLLEFDVQEDDEILSSDSGEHSDDEEIDDSESFKFNKTNVNEWRTILQKPNSKPECLKAMRSMIKAFRQTVTQTRGDDEHKGDEGKNNSKGFKNKHFLNKKNLVMEPELFNLIMNSVLFDLVPALTRYLKVFKQNLNEDQTINHSQSIYDPRKSRNWKRIHSSIKMYLTDVLKMIEALSQEARISFQRHLLELLPFYQVYVHLLKRVIRRSIQEWYSSEEERTRVLSFLIIYRSVRVIQSNEHLTLMERQTAINQVLRQMYLSFAMSSKTTNENTIKKITFMRNSLIELYNLDHEIAYQQTFIFVRQLAISLRKASMGKEKDSMKKIYNWQFLNSILLWSQLIGSIVKQQMEQQTKEDSDRKSQLFQSMVTPITNVSHKTLSLFPSFKYLSFWLPIIDSMVKLSVETSTVQPQLHQVFVEVLEFIAQHKHDIIANNKKKMKVKTNGVGSTKKSSKKSINVDLQLKVTREQTFQLTYVEQIMDRLYAIMLYYLKCCSNKVWFMAATRRFRMQCRSIIRSSIIYRKGRTMFKQLLDKCDENDKFILKKFYEEKQQNNQLNSLIVSDSEWICQDETPLILFYKQWKLLKQEPQNNAEDVNVDELETTEFNAKQTSFDLDDLEDDFDEMDFENEDDEGSEVELTEEQMRKLQAKIEQEENGEMEDENDQEKPKKKRKKKKRNKNKKPRQLNPNLNLEGAFNLSSSDDENDNNDS